MAPICTKVVRDLIIMLLDKHGVGFDPNAIRQTWCGI